MQRRGWIFYGPKGVLPGCEAIKTDGLPAGSGIGFGDAE